MPPRRCPLFAPSRQTSTLGPALVDLLTTAPADHWHPYFGFLVLPVPAPVLRTDPTLATLGTLHPFQGGICRLPPHCCYTWHMDTRRGAAVNLLVHHTHSHTLFTDAASVRGRRRRARRPRRRTRLRPEHVLPVPLPTAAHGPERCRPRYSLSLEFAADQVTLPYAELHAELAAQGLVEVPP